MNAAVYAERVCRTLPACICSGSSEECSCTRRVKASKVPVRCTRCGERMYRIHVDRPRPRPRTEGASP